MLETVMRKLPRPALAPAALVLITACGSERIGTPSARDPTDVSATRDPAGAASPEERRAMPTPEESADGWLPLFNGKDLTGWTVVGSGDWKVKDGELVIESAEHGPTAARKRMLGWLASTAEFSSFELSIEFMFERGWDSGVLFRSRLSLLPWEDGYEIQLLDDAEATKQGLPQIPFDCFPSGTLLGRAKATLAPDNYLARGQWQKVLLKAHGPRIQVELNGHAALNVEDATFPSGHLGIQYYAHDLALRVRRVLVRPMAGGDKPGGTWGPVFLKSAGV
jgi:hypothetical protein